MHTHIFYAQTTRVVTFYWSGKSNGRGVAKLKSFPITCIAGFTTHTCADMHVCHIVFIKCRKEVVLRDLVVLTVEEE